MITITIQLAKAGTELGDKKEHNYFVNLHHYRRLGQEGRPLALMKSSRWMLDQKEVAEAQSRPIDREGYECCFLRFLLDVLAVVFAHEKKRFESTI